MMRRWIIVIALFGLAVFGVYQFNQFRQRQQATALSSLQTVRAERGPLTATIGATGTVRANQSAILIWQTIGTVDEVSVPLGSLVKSGDALASLKLTSLQQNIILAEVELINAQKTLADLLDPPTELSLAQARQAITEAEKAVQDADRRLNSLNASARQTDIDTARASVTLTRDVLEKARKAFAPYENKSEDNLIRANLQTRLAQAQREYDQAVARLNNLLGSANATDIALAESNLEVAQAGLADAQENYEKMLNGADEDDIIAAETRIAAIQATLAQSHVAAPFTGTITQIQSKPGDQVSPGSVAFRLDDLSHLLVDVRVSEVDINRIVPGQNVLLTFDGIQGKEYQGVVIEVAQVGSVVQGIVEFEVTVELTNPDESVRPGMTAAVNIVINQLQDVLLVPNRAVRILDGKRVVYILKNGTLEPVNLTLGVSSDTMSEALESSLQVGDEIVINPPQVFNTNGPPPFVQR